MRAAIAVLVAALALSASACGGGDDSDGFRDGYNAAVEKLRSVNSEIVSATGGARGPSNKEIAREFDKIADAADETRSDLTGLDPPSGAEDEFDRLLASLKKGVADLRALADAAAHDDPHAAAVAVRSLRRSGKQITRAEDALKKAVEG